jgi:hypothetical protein
MTVRLSTTIRKIKTVSNPENLETILRFFEFMKGIGAAERYQNNNLKAITAYGRFLGTSDSLYQIKSKHQMDSNVHNIRIGLHNNNFS